MADFWTWLSGGSLPATAAWVALALVVLWLLNGGYEKAERWANRRGRTLDYDEGPLRDIERRPTWTDGPDDT